MTKKNLINLSLAASYVITTLIIGCIPEDSLQWSRDGSKGIYSKKGTLFLVDGNTGTLTQIAPKETTTLWPAISPDGSLFAYSQIVNVSDFNNAFKLLPADQVREISGGAEILRQRIITQDFFDGNIPSLDNIRNEQHLAWVHRYLAENADAQLADKTGSDPLGKIKEKPLSYYQLIMSPVADPNVKKIIMTSNRQLWRLRFSPDSKLIAWVIDNKTDKAFDAGFDLYIARISEKSPGEPAFIAPAIAISYDFRPDGRAIAYIKPETENFKGQELVLGSLVEKTIIDPEGKFLVSPDKETPKRYTCTGPAKELAGVIYYSWMSASYGRDGRIFFSSVKLSVPSSKLDSEEGSVFCCDTLTGTVGDILPQIALDFTQGNYYLFQLSNDSSKILLPGNKNTLGIYAMGPDIESSKILVDVNESFGEDSPPKLVPQWKGPNHVSCLVSEKSHYLTNDPNTPHRRKEIIVLDSSGNLVQILSRDWPDDLLNF
ncbi:MAG: hypothetical protein JW749_03990 [Sedimentisphaerales bacterium]|nr:hypothetical protein [Sedimentisphaerales bacterium]